MTGFTKILVFAASLFSLTAHALPGLVDLKCSASNGVQLKLISPATSQANYAVVNSTWGFAEKKFIANLSEGQNGTTLIHLESANVAYVIAANLDLSSTTSQHVSGNLIQINNSSIIPPLFISKIDCNLQLQ